MADVTQAVWGPAEHVRKYAEWDWLYTTGRGGKCLHHAAELHDPENWEQGGFMATTTCGRTLHMTLPGLLSRMGLPRCKRCCRLLGIKDGTGSPKNDPELRPWLVKRPAALGESASS